jgi:hypothetical protein
MLAYTHSCRRECNGRTISQLVRYIAPNRHNDVDVPRPDDRVNSSDEAMFEEPEYQRKTCDIPSPNLSGERNEDKYGYGKPERGKFWIQHCVDLCTDQKNRSRAGERGGTGQRLRLMLTCAIVFVGL